MTRRSILTRSSSTNRSPTARPPTSASPCSRGAGLQDLSIVGPGRIDGNRRSRGGPKPIALKECRDVTIRDLTLENAPNYNISLLGCDHVDIRGVTIRNGYSDGIDPDCCRHVRIIGAAWNPGRRDRAQEQPRARGPAIDGVRRRDRLRPRQRPQRAQDRHRVLRRLQEHRVPELHRCRGGRALGSAALRPEAVSRAPASRSRTWTAAGSSRSSSRESPMVNVRAPIFVRLGERGQGQTVPAAGTLTKITISDVVATGAEWTSSITGVPGHDVSDIALSDIRISGKGGGDAALVTRPVPEQDARVSRRRAVPQSSRPRPVLPARDGAARRAVHAHRGRARSPAPP